MKKIRESLTTTAYHIMVILGGKDIIGGERLIKEINAVKTPEDAKTLAKELTKKSPEYYDIIYDTILENTVKEDERLARNVEWSFGRI